MSQLATKYVAKKFGKRLNAGRGLPSDEEFYGDYRNVYEPVLDRHGKQVVDKKGNLKTKRKEHPFAIENISEEDRQLLKQVKKRAYKMDNCLFKILGVRFGWSSVIGLFPEVGDFIDMAIAISVVNMCRKAKLPTLVILGMIVYVIGDFLVGLVPLLGDLLDARIRCNTRNAKVLEQQLIKRYSAKNEKYPITTRSHTDPDLLV
ncbi:MAG: hypothetical protein M1819_000344 [Sarea resinae]|nr:MAG: hypothetical protein M1819_000344 [Sarea resinae]